MEKTVLITGANRGLGLALAEAFESSHALVLHSRKEDESLLQRFPKARFIHGDLTDKTSFLRWKCDLGAATVSVLINNAGIYAAKTMEEMDPVDITRVIETNLMAPMLMTKLLWDRLEKDAVIVNIGSIAGTSPAFGESIYAASKAGLAGFSKGLQFDATEKEVLIINIELGSMLTGMIYHRPDSEKLMDPEDVAETIVSLCTVKKSLRMTSVDIMRRIY